VHVNDAAPFRDWLPYVAAVVDLEEGPRVMTNLVDVDPGDLAVGMDLVVGYREASPEITIPIFRPAPQA
jgi:uncharacterized OB-fold protein